MPGGLMRSSVLGPLMLALMAVGVVAQESRDVWLHLRNAVDLEQRLVHSLGDVPVNAEERAQIYTLIDDKSIHESFRDDQREEERKVVLSTRIGLIRLAQNGSQQILVRGPLQFCGGTGNCPIWILMRHRGKARLILADEGKALLVGKSSWRGFPDLVIPFHVSAMETSLSVYRWNGNKYKRIDCYLTKPDPLHPENAVIQDCPEVPR